MTGHIWVRDDVLLTGVNLVYNIGHREQWLDASSWVERGCWAWAKGRSGYQTENRGELPLFIIDPQESLTKNNFTILIIKHHSHCRCCSMLQRHTLSLVMHTMSDGIATRPCWKLNLVWGGLWAMVSKLTSSKTTPVFAHQDQSTSTVTPYRRRKNRYCIKHFRGCNQRTTTFFPLRLYYFIGGFYWKCRSQRVRGSRLTDTIHWEKWEWINPRG